jgi:hypothetical protein
MPGTRVSPKEQAQIVAMRSAGYTMPSIANHSGRSLASVKRICTQSKVKPGLVTEELIQTATKHLMDSVCDDRALQKLAATQLQDTLAHSALCRDKLLEASEQLNASTPQEALQVARACASWANSIKLTGDAIRSALKICPEQEFAEDLPEYSWYEISNEDVEALREAQRKEELEIFGSDANVTPA